MPEITEKSLEYRERMFCSESAIFWIPGHRGDARCWPKTWKRGLDQDRGDLRQRFDTVRREKSIFSGGSKLAHFTSLLVGILPDHLRYCGDRRIYGEKGETVISS